MNQKVVRVLHCRGAIATVLVILIKMVLRVLCIQILETVQYKSYDGFLLCRMFQVQRFLTAHWGVECASTACLRADGTDPLVGAVDIREKAALLALWCVECLPETPLQVIQKYKIIVFFLNFQAERLQLPPAPPPLAQWNNAPSFPARVVSS